MNTFWKDMAGHTITMSKIWAGYRQRWGGNHPTWKVSVSIGGKRPMWVSFHDAIANGRKDEWSEEEWLECLRCILLDAFGYENNPDEGSFLREFGYDGDNMAEGKRAYKLCRSTYEKLSKMADIDELIAICNAIR